MPGRVPNQAGEIARRHGWHHVFAPSTAWGGGHEGLAIVSRFPIGAHEAQPLPHSTGDGRADRPVGAHRRRRGRVLGPHDPPRFRETEGRKREDQVMFIDEVVAAHANDNVQIVMGDFNAVPDSDEIRWLTGMTTLGGRRVAYQDAWARANAVGSGGSDRPGSPGRARTRTSALMHWLRPDRRLDYIFTTQVRRDGRGTRPRRARRVRRAGARPRRASACSRRITSA